MADQMPESPLPDDLPSFTVPLPLPITGRHREEGPTELTELTFAFEKTEERGYTSGGESMYAATYSAETEVGVASGALVVNALTERVTMAVAQVVHSMALYYALIKAYTEQDPPLPPPANPGISAPLFQAALDTPDGTVRLRGMCAGLRSLHPDLVATVDVVVPPAFHEPKGGGEEK